MGSVLLLGWYALCTPEIPNLGECSTGGNVFLISKGIKQFMQLTVAGELMETLHGSTATPPRWAIMLVLFLVVNIDRLPNELSKVLELVSGNWNPGAIKFVANSIVEIRSIIHLLSSPITFSLDTPALPHHSHH